MTDRADSGEATTDRDDADAATDASRIPSSL
ncbi:MAG: hypothetical protein ACI9YT_002818, partial [Halobacteriales archaeon]